MQNQREVQGGQQILQVEVNAACENRETEDNPAAWLEEDFEDDDDNLPFDAGLAEA